MMHSLGLVKPTRAQTTMMAQVALINLITPYNQEKPTRTFGRFLKGRGQERMVLHAPHGPTTRM